MELQDFSNSHKKVPDCISELNPEPQSTASRLRIFLSMVLLNILVNYDTGVIPASIPEIRSEMPLNLKQTAGIGSSVYIGLCSATFIVSIIFHKYSAKKVLLSNIVLNCCFCLLFAISSNIYIIYLSRFGMGFTQAFCVIYAPVWINEFAPTERATQWLGILQCSVPLGVVSGYATASLFNTSGISYLTWREAILIQGFLEIPLILNLFCVDNATIDVLHKIKAEKALLLNINQDLDNFEKMNNLTDVFTQMRILLSNWLFLCLILGLSSMIFVVSGIQYWLSFYMKEVLKTGNGTIMIGFILISTTAPIIGVVFGGYLSDRLGGYKGDNSRRAIRLCLFFAVLAFICAILAAFCEIAELLLTYIWLLIFFGACLMPSAVGMSMDCISKEFQSSSSSLTQFMFNFGGFFLAPILTAVFMDTIDNRQQALTWGFRFTLFFSTAALGFIISAYVCIQKSFSKRSSALFLS